MAIFNYNALDKEGNGRQGTIEAVNMDVAIAALQRRGLVVSGIDGASEKSVLGANIEMFSGVKNKDVVMLSRQITTLFEAQVSALRAFRLLAAESQSPVLADKLSEVANDIQSGSSISAALSRHPKVFSPFYVNMVRAGEEAGKLDETFSFLADYLDRNYEITQKARNALVYPAFVMMTFIVVMVMMMTLVIPRLSGILLETGQQIPIYTRVVIGISNFMAEYILLLAALFVVGVVFVIQYSRTENGRQGLSRARLAIPHIGNIFQQLFLSRLSDNLATMLRSGIQMVRGIEITASVVDDPVYEKILTDSVNDVKAGLPLSEVLRKHPEIPGMVVAMIKIGEETGNLSQILDTLSKFYRREVSNSIDTLVSLIEPFMIVSLAVGVAFLLAAVLIPIYNISAGF
ncbi:MAG: type II secretion system F family protein [Candidatus Pacebacteria bacterium]|nr:type II secretion system F family protein [Candidatus Paceibacterota bacterium]